MRRLGQLGMWADRKMRDRKMKGTDRIAGMTDEDKTVHRFMDFSVSFIFLSLIFLSASLDPATQRHERHSTDRKMGDRKMKGRLGESEIQSTLTRLPCFSPLSFCQPLPSRHSAAS